jgi:type I restriction enzyme R subunit
MAGWLADWPSTLRKRLKDMPPVDGRGLWPAQVKAVGNLEQSLAADKPRALIQMATGSGKTFTAVNAIYRLIKHADARRVLFLVDRANLGRQAENEFRCFDTPDDGRKFDQLYNVDHLQGRRPDPVARVCISTIQRLYSILQGKELPPEADEVSSFETMDDLRREPMPVVYNPSIPIEFFDVIVIDECHRSIYTLWKQVLDYFDAYLIGLTATPSKQTFGFFNKNLVMEYGHEQAVIDAVNVDFNVYTIATKITQSGSTVEAGFQVGKRDRATRKMRWETLDDDLEYDAKALDRDVVAKDQIRTIIRTFRDRLPTEIFPGRTEVPKTLIYAKDDSHADEIVQVVREEFGKGNDFCQKITYRTGTARIVTPGTDDDGNAFESITYKSSGVKAEHLLSDFRNRYYPRIVVTVDMIATGTDIKPLEVVMFMRAVKSRNFFEQMKGRGVRVIKDADFRAVTPDARSKTHFVIVDCVGQCETKLIDTKPLEANPTVAFDKLLQAVGGGSTDPDVLSSIASRLTRLDKALAPADRDALAGLAGGRTVRDLAADLVAALDPDRHADAARLAHDLPPDAEPSPEQLAQAAEAMRLEAAMPLMTSPTLRKALVDTKQRAEQTIDEVSIDEVLHSGYSADATDRARTVIESFEAFLDEHRDEITALQVLYSRPHARRLRFADIKALAEAIQAPPRRLTPEVLWRAYEALDRSRVRGASAPRLLTDIVSLVRFATHQDDELSPFREQVDARFADWLARQEAAGRRFSPEQREWLALIRDHIAANLAIEPDDFDYSPFNQRGGLGRVYSLFGDEFEQIIGELNEVLAA